MTKAVDINSLREKLQLTLDEYTTTIRNYETNGEIGKLVELAQLIGGQRVIKAILKGLDNAEIRFDSIKN